MNRGYTTPFRGKYLIRNPLANGVITLVDACLWLWRLGTKRHGNIPLPQKILISNISQLGDVIMMTSLLPALKKALPEVKVGVIVGSGAEQLVHGHSLIDHVHFLDHWKVARSSLSRWDKIKRYRDMRLTALKEIQDVHYDCALECCYYFPNTIRLIDRAKIPVRIGFTSGGFGPLLTHPVQWTNRLQSAAHHFADLLSLITPIDRTFLKPTLPLISCSSILPPKTYLVIHMGSGNPIKEWPTEHWHLLCQKLTADGHTLAFTGKGEKEAHAIHSVIQDLPRCINLCDRLSWEEFIALIKEAKLLIGVDTGPGHIAAATATPSVLIYSGINPIQHWSPFSPTAHILMHPMPCYPCYKMNGCTAMECVRNVSVETMYQKIRSLL